MSNTINTNKWRYTFKKLVQLNRNNALLRRRLNSKAKQKKKRKLLYGLSKTARKAKVRHDIQHKNYVHIVAPVNLSFVDNTLQVINFINKLQAQFDNKKQVFVVLRKVENLTYDALVVLLSIMVKFKSQKIGFNGDIPQNKKALQILEKSGFLQLLYLDYSYNKRYDLSKGSALHTHAAKDVDSELGDQIIAAASQTIWKESRRCQGVQRAFVELMQNTNNHASLTHEGEKHWWLSVYHIPKEKKVAFAFIDFGVGVFTSLAKKTTGSKWYGWFEKLSKTFTFKNNADLLKLILEGELHRTATGKYYRGKGLPGLKTVMDRNQLSNLHVITNNVRANVNEGNYEVLNSNFGGTFIYWELNEHNASCRG